MRHPPGLRTSINRVLTRIEVECAHESRREQERALKELQGSETLKEYRAIKKKIDALEKMLEPLRERLEEEGLTVWNEDKPELTQAKRDAILIKFKDLKKKFEDQRDSILVRAGFVEPSESQFMLKYFLKEASDTFPNIKALVGSLNGKKES